MISQAFTAVGKDLLEHEPELAYIKASNCRITFLVSDQKKMKGKLEIMAEAEVIPEKYKWGVETDFTITIYPLNCANFNEQQRRILLFQQLLKLEIEYDDKTNEETYKIKEYDVNDFSIIIKKYGTNWKQTQKELFED